MGNAFVCLSHTPFVSSDAPITLVHGFGGSIQQLHERPKVAEVMLENPGNFVCRGSSLSSGQRFAALPADEELSAAALYFLLPMHKLHKRVSVEESDFFCLMATKGGRAKAFSSQSSKVSPSVAPWQPPTCLQSSSISPPSIQQAESFSQRLNPLRESALDLSPGPVQTLVRCKSWKPNLQTISEVRNGSSSPLRAVLQCMSNYCDLPSNYIRRADHNDRHYDGSHK